MLTISPGASEVIKHIVTSSQVTEEGGIRLSVERLDDQSAKLDLTIANSPEPGDSLVEKEGAKVFVDEDAARLLDDKMLDAALEGDKVSFAIVEQPQDWSQNGQPEGIDPNSIS